MITVEPRLTRLELVLPFLRDFYFAVKAISPDYGRANSKWTATKDL